MSDGKWRGVAARASSAISHPEGIPPDHLLKSGTRRLVFLLQASDGAVIVKAFPLRGLRTRLKEDKYAPSEARHLEQARQRGLPVPSVYGVGARRDLGMVRWNAVMMEKIEGRNFAEVMGDTRCEAEWQDYVNRSVELFRLVYEAGCNHIDLKPEALIFGREAADDRIIDFQYCRFRAEPRLTTLMAQAGHFAHWWLKTEQASDAEVEAWVNALLDTTEVTSDKRADARSIFDANRTRVPSIADRLKQ